MHDRLRKARWLVGVAWVMSWFELYLEIYRHHHVTRSLLLHPGSWWEAGQIGQPRPGGWLLTVLVSSALLPLLFLVLLASQFVWRRRATHVASTDHAAFPFAVVSAVIGVALGGLATVNQLIRHPPIEVDLTLRAGNGGFIVLGAVLFISGTMLARRERDRRPHHGR